MSRKIRVLVAKPGLDGHERGAFVVIRALRDSGIEVIYTGIRQTPEMIVNAALQEGVDVIGLSILSGAHIELVQQIMNLLKEKGIEDTPVLVGGIIPKQDREILLQLGVRGVFGPGTTTDQILNAVKSCIAE
jgi:methylmalonyl-CoA mutase C-terminal domain/subunit